MIVLRVWEISIRGTRREALYLALGAAFVEIFYAAIALHLNLLAYRMDTFYPYVYFFVAMFMLFYAYRAHTRTVSERSATPIKSRIGPLREGLFLGVTNLLPIPFWVAVTLHMQEWKLLHLEYIHIFWSYVVGIGVGTWLFLCFVVYLSERLAFLRPKGRLHSRVFSWAYVAVALYFFYRGV